MVDLKDLPVEELQRTAAAGAEVMECLMVLAKTGGNVVVGAAGHTAKHLARGWRSITWFGLYFTNRTT